MDLETEIKKYYETFKGLPSDKPIVRQNQINDAFEIVVYNLLFRENKFSILTKNDIEELSSYIISPPDDSIDIFYEDISGDDFVYHIVQVKNSKLDEANIKKCFASMNRTINNYIDDPKKVSFNARSVISNTNFDEITKTNIKFYVVHTGSISTIKDLKENEKIINLDEIETLLKSIKEFSVPYYKFKIADEKEYLEYKNTQNERKSIICTIRASELAELTEKYINTDIGRNILFGQNLREALKKGSKTYEGIKNTIKEEPENFWYYNNGITIVSRELNYDDNEITLKNFSIINGAQTSNSFVQYKQDINRDYSGDEKIKFLKKLSKVSVLARIVETAENISFKNKITLFNNTQNPISTRDMVSNNDEQVKLKSRFLEKKPYIFIEIRRGELRPKDKRFLKHRIITNIELAQFIYAGFLQNPFNAKDKKVKIFNKDNSTDNIVNPFYDKIFSLDKGVAHKLTNDQLDELLFIKELHKKSKKYLSSNYNEQLKELKKELETADDENKKVEIENEIREFNKLKQINNINTFYNITLYYHFKATYDKIFKASNKKFDIELFYNNKNNYQKELIKEFAKLTNQNTIKIIKKLAYDDPPKFVRAKQSEKLFIENLKEMFREDFSYKDNYKVFIRKFKK